MKVCLYIKDKLIEGVEVSAEHFTMFEKRKQVVNDYVQYLKLKYRHDIMLTCQWEIIVKAESKMNCRNVTSVLLNNLKTRANGIGR